MDKISICLCSYNDAPYLDLLLRSCHDTIRLPYEVCLVDNASRDNTLEVVDRWRRMGVPIRYHLNDVNEGVCAVNRSVIMSDGDYVVDINSDMFFIRDCVQRMYQQLLRLESRNPISTVSATMVLPRGGAGMMHITQEIKPDPIHMDYEKCQNLQIPVRSNVWHFLHPIMMGRDLWDRVGGLDTGYPFPGFCTDLDLAMKIIQINGWMVQLGDAFCYHFVHATFDNMPQEEIETTKDRDRNTQQRFRNKWKISSGDFYRHRKMRQPFEEMDLG